MSTSSWVFIVEWAESNVRLEFGRGLKKKVQDPFTRKDWYGIKVSSVLREALGFLLTENRLLPCLAPESKTPNLVEWRYILYEAGLEAGGYKGRVADWIGGIVLERPSSTAPLV